MARNIPIRPHALSVRSSLGGEYACVYLHTRLIAKGQWQARIPDMGREWLGPWDSEMVAIRSICQIYSIGGP